MRKTTISLILLSIILMVSCNGKHDARISTALSLADSDMADSALNILNKIDRNELPNSDDAMYCLVYTMAQDKSGLDVDNDSLIREAYDWYGKKPTDTLYAKCMYYMGKYYALNDSSEKALTCFQRANQTAKAQNDYDIQCLALLQQSVILRNYDVDKAIADAKAAVNIYNVKGAKLSNKVYYLLNLAECMSYGGRNPNTCIYLAHEAVKYALQSKDSTIISNSYQDLSVFYGIEGDTELALEAAKKSYVYNTGDNFSKGYSLSQFYVMADSIDLAKKAIAETTPLSINDSILLYSLKRTIAIKEHNWVGAEKFADSTDFYLDKRNSENLEARNKYYSLMLQKEIARTKLSSESQWKSNMILLIVVTSFIIILLLSLVFIQKKKILRERMEDEKKIHQMELNHKERQLATMRNFLLSRINIVNSIKKIKPSDFSKLKLTDNDWEEIEVTLNSTDDEFVIRLKNEFKDLTQKDLRFLMLVRLKIPYEGIASIYNIKEESVKQRLFLFKKKLGLEKSKVSTREFIEEY